MADNNNVATAGKARQQAINTLIQNHKQEYDQLYAQKRAEYGLPERKTKQARQQEKIDALEKRLEEARQALAALS